MRLNPKKTKSMEVSRSRTIASGYDDLTLGGDEIKELQSLGILEITLVSNLTLEIHLREVVSKAACRALTRKVNWLSTCAGELFQCIDFVQLGVLCPRVDAAGGVSYLGWLDGIVRSAEKLCDGELCCLGYRRKVNILYLRYKIYHRVGHSMNEYLNRFVIARNTRALAALGVLALVIPRYKADQFSRSFLPAVVRLSNFLPSGVFTGGSLSSVKSAMNVSLLRA